MEIDQFFDSLTRELEERAARAAIIGHAGSIGKVREFVIQEMLGKFLPSAVSITSGRIFDSQGQMSKQIDVAVVDGRMPVLRLDGNESLIPVESLIASIEIKSRLTRDELEVACDNCLSVLNLSPQVDPRSVRQFRELENSKSLPQGAASRFLFHHTMPHTFVLAIEGPAARSTLVDWIQDWFKTRQGPERNGEWLLPDLISCPGLVAQGSRRSFDMADVIVEGDQPGFGAVVPARSKYASVWGTNAAFGWLASDLLRACEDRFGARHAATGHGLSISAYLPYKRYVENRSESTSISITADQALRQVPLGQVRMQSSSDASPWH